MQQHFDDEAGHDDAGDDELEVRPVRGDGIEPGESIRPVSLLPSADPPPSEVDRPLLLQGDPPSIPPDQGGV